MCVDLFSGDFPSFPEKKKNDCVYFSKGKKSLGLSDAPNFIFLRKLTTKMDIEQKLLWQGFWQVNLLRGWLIAHIIFAYSDDGMMDQWRLN